MTFNSVAPLLPHGLDVRPGFRSFKCRDALHYPRRVCRDALILGTLDPQIETITAASQIDGKRDAHDEFFAFIAIQSGRRCLIRLCETTDRIDATGDRAGNIDVTVCLSRERLLADGVAVTGRTVWARRKLQVQPAFSIGLLRKLRDKPAGLCLGEFPTDGMIAHSDAVDWTLAMACTGLVTLSIRQPISDRTRIFPGPAALAQAESPLMATAQISLQFPAP
jgi:hypothetical protein